MSELEGDVYYPDPSIAATSHVPNADQLRAEALADPAGFWADRASELEWFKPWDKVIDDSNAPFYKWFTGAEVNIVHNCLDRHMSGPNKNKLALIWQSEDGQEHKTFSYFSLHRRVNQMANIIKAMGVTKGDRVTIYLPRIPEVFFAMLACAKIGAIHSVIFAGFSADALTDRIDDSQSKLVITADGSWINGSVFPLKEIVDKAVRFSPTVENVIVVKRTGSEVTMDPLRDHWYHDLLALPIAKGTCETVPVDAEHPLYILYTSGSTGKPKGILHTSGGYLTGAATTFRYIFDHQDSDVFWCTADVGWVTGHSYIVYGPMANGATQVMYEGAPNTPDWDRFWKIIADHKVTVFYTAPTAIRSFIKAGDQHVDKHDLSSLRLLGSVGEPINPEAWIWYHQKIGAGRCPIVDTWWQTETGAILISPIPGATPLKPGTATRPFFGIDAAILDETGQECGPNEGGKLVIRKPWPSMLRTLWGDPERFKATYWSEYEGIYLAGDGARRDEDGYFWIVGRLDDVLNVSGHRLGTAEVESALVSHPAVAEAAVVGRPDEIKGQGVVAFVTVKTGVPTSKELALELRNHVAKEIGAIAKPDDIRFAATLPKTRSGKIMRRLLKEIVSSGEVKGDVTTLEDFNAVASLQGKGDEE